MTSASRPGCSSSPSEARALYERIGYREVPRFSDKNPYAGHWFEKRLD